MELSAILSGNFWGDLMESIIKCGLGPYIGKKLFKFLTKQITKLILHKMAVLVFLCFAVALIETFLIFLSCYGLQ